MDMINPAAQLYIIGVGATRLYRALHDFTRHYEPSSSIPNGSMRRQPKKRWGIFERRAIMAQSAGHQLVEIKYGEGRGYAVQPRVSVSAESGSDMS